MAPGYPDRPSKWPFLPNAEDGRRASRALCLPGFVWSVTQRAQSGTMLLWDILGLSYNLALRNCVLCQQHCKGCTLIWSGNFFAWKKRGPSKQTSLGRQSLNHAGMGRPACESSGSLTHSLSWLPPPSATCHAPLPPGATAQQSQPPASHFAVQLYWGVISMPRLASVASVQLGGFRRAVGPSPPAQPPHCLLAGPRMFSSILSR